MAFYFPCNSQWTLFPFSPPSNSHILIFTYQVVYLWSASQSSAIFIIYLVHLCHFYKEGSQSNFYHSFLLYFILRRTLWGKLGCECVMVQGDPDSFLSRVGIYTSFVMLERLSFGLCQSERAGDATGFIHMRTAWRHCSPPLSTMFSLTCFQAVVPAGPKPPLTPDKFGGKNLNLNSTHECSSLTIWGITILFYQSLALQASGKS